VRPTHLFCCSGSNSFFFSAAAAAAAAGSAAALGFPVFSAIVFSPDGADFEVGVGLSALGLRSRRFEPRGLSSASRD